MLGARPLLYQPNMIDAGRRMNGIQKLDYGEFKI